MAIPQRNTPAASPVQGSVRVGKILRIDSGGAAIVEIDDQPIPAEIAAHLPWPVPGQRVAVMQDAEEPALVLAAYPLREAAAMSNGQDSGVQSAGVGFDPTTGTLRIHAQRLDLTALGSVEIRCGDSVLRFNAQGSVVLEAQAITQSSIGPYRIEGASIDLN
ncbi:hypothetical protein QRO08_05375 [Paracidovorax citrulli]|uniref:Gp5/Type VI secretion system Vgr protein OB-fold domain-containing protein n=2 Tax=Paracidovorax citrulli TaxID=80869 RepID=A1TTP2_PARC0|nr:hypothetical protein [Paracidovorax citrulli]ABM34330.1 hypothetical protein Aave_3784 [Paracidovorax citrulli AAC00-1]ATG93811.1 hypothetical protein CQB05_07040 [Paracidovorax citrulli]PVY63773.1 hypothetical protein C8E08_1074 [Paracidovorax citrulli]REG67263.1 hypothetical protein C8E07_0316 [Paracidovorax citrulli]RLJ91823.1 hypothetical protein C8E06_0317 [Paracidovorax citrulli]